MPRRRTTPIAESHAELAQLRRHHRGTVNEARMALLAELKSHPTTPMAECAAAAGLSTRQAERLWKKYREGGLAGVVEQRMRRLDNDDSASGGYSQGIESVNSIPALLNLLAEVRSARSLKEWSVVFRQLITELIPEVEYVCFLLRGSLLPTSEVEGMIGSKVTNRTVVNGESVGLSVGTASHTNERWKGLVAQAYDVGIPMTSYSSAAFGVDCYSRSSLLYQDSAKLAYVGSYAFFVGSKFDRFPLRASSAIESLRPFLVDMISARSNYEAREVNGRAMLDRFVGFASIRFALSRTEAAVLLCAVDGHPNSEIAKKLGISTSTVNSHLGTVYRKIGSSGRNDLVRRLVEVFDDHRLE